ncbi:hypothetical protein [Chitinibacter sp. GC72]|uniref:glycine-rich domain-containing protein n=1 Tax=Chitinibacter sp. GC72 TaxID=1526917 RepID=UPI0012F80005|nr:hypothetical protein [Chitinibacter sp. GC72]
MLFKFLLLILIGVVIYHYLKRRRQQEQFYYLNHYRFPSGIRRRLALKYPELNDAQWLQVENAMRQYFRLHAKSKAALAMPSLIVDEYWHEFILHTAVYEEFCKKALGRFLHHTPATGAQGHADLQRTWVRACRDEGLNPALATLPLIFAIDAALAIPGGQHYSGAQLAAAAQSTSSCSSSGCSSTDRSDDHDSGSSDSGCSSSCGGGGD